MTVGEAILAEIKAMHHTLKQAIQIMRSTQAAPQGAPAQQRRAVEIAADKDLDGQYGDPQIRHNPHRWKGDSMIGRTLSQCPPEYLDMWAEMKDFFAGKDDLAGAVDGKGNPKSKWGRLDAARARGWAQRMRNKGYVSKAPAQPKLPAAQPQWSSGGWSEGMDDVPPPEDDIPF